MIIANYCENDDRDYYTVEITDGKYVDVVYATDDFDGNKYFYVIDCENGKEVFEDLNTGEGIAFLQDFGLKGQDVIDYVISVKEVQEMVDLIDVEANGEVK